MNLVLIDHLPEVCTRVLHGALTSNKAGATKATDPAGIDIVAVSHLLRQDHSLAVIWKNVAIAIHVGVSELDGEAHNNN